MLPKGSGIFEIQKKFVNGYLKQFYDRCKENGIEVLAFFGNDDIYTRKKYFKKYGTLLDEVPYQKDGYEFKAYPFVQDYPFGLKTACKWDSIDWRCPEKYIHKPSDVSEQGWVNIPDTNAYFSAKGTIEDDLKAIHATNKTIMAIHQPPWALSLDVCMDGRRVGSEAVYNWIQREQPLVVLCGHIHENYTVTGVWKTYIDKSIVIQPGQSSEFENKIRIVLIELNETAHAELVDIPTKDLYVN